MKRVFFTESQIRRILQEEYPLSTDDANELSPVDRMDTVTTDQPIANDDDMNRDFPALSKNYGKTANRFWHGMGGKARNVTLPDMVPTFFAESEEYDNTKTHGMVNLSTREFASQVDTSTNSAKSNFVKGLRGKNTLSADMMRLKREEEKGENADPQFVKALKSAIDQQKKTNAGLHAGGTHTTVSPKSSPTGGTIKNPETGESVPGKKCEDGNNIYYF